MVPASMCRSASVWQAGHFDRKLPASGLRNEIRSRPEHEEQRHQHELEEPGQQHRNHHVHHAATIVPRRRSFAGWRSFPARGGCSSSTRPNFGDEQLAPTSTRESTDHESADAQGASLAAAGAVSPGATARRSSRPSSRAAGWCCRRGSAAAAPDRRTPTCPRAGRHRHSPCRPRTSPRSRRA